MSLRYTFVISIFFILLAFSRGFVFSYHNSLFNAPIAHADDGGGGGDGGGDGGGGGDAGGDGGSGGGDAGGDSGGTGGDAGGDSGGSAGDTGGDAGSTGGDVGGDSGSTGDAGGDAGDNTGDIGGDAGASSGDVGGDAGSDAGDVGGDTGNSAGDVGGDTGGNTSDTGGDVVPPAPLTPIFGCMDSTATNYNPLANRQTGVICTYTPPVIPPAIIYGCMDSTATNYNSLATSQTGVVCTYPPVVPPVIPPVVPPVVPPVAPPPTSHGGGGGSVRTPNVTLAMLTHTQPLSYLYLSQIPYTGLDLGPVGTVLYWIALIGWSLALAYLVLFGVAPAVNRRMRVFSARVSALLNTTPTFALAGQDTAVSEAFPAEAEAEQEAPEAQHGYSSYDGFKSFARHGALSVEDIVKGLSQKHFTDTAPHAAEPTVNVEPVYQNVEPIYENVEPIASGTHTDVDGAPADIRGFVIALVEGDRTAVFAGLRQHVRGGGAPEKIINAAVCLLDDVYRARIDGTECDAILARITARLSTPTLEKLIVALTTAIDSSYSSGVTGAKLALTRALAVLGA